VQLPINVKLMDKIKDHLCLARPNLAKQGMESTRSEIPDRFLLNPFLVFKWFWDHASDTAFM
jgi:hypothetical protein